MTRWIVWGFAKLWWRTSRLRRVERMQQRERMVVRIMSGELVPPVLKIAILAGSGEWVSHPAFTLSYCLILM